MNIFCFSRCERESAKWAPDKLVVKMPLESAQLLATCFPLDRLAAEDCPRTMNGDSRKHFNPKHPCSIWVRQTTENFNWLLAHTFALLHEKYERYPNNGRHFVHDFVDWVNANKNDAICPAGYITEFPLCINEDKNCRKIAGFDNLDRVEQYRLYLKHDKPYATWIRNKPDWF